MTIKLGIVGGGAIGSVHATAAKAVGSDIVDLRCIADVDEKAAKKLAAQHGNAHTTADPQQLFDDKDIDAVVIGVPNRFHAPLAVAALKAGKDVLLEKPMALSVAECQQINDAAASTGQILQMGFVQRYSSVAVTGRRLVDAGRLGKLYHIKTSTYRRRGIPGLGGWFTTKAMSGGGPLIDIGVHAIDLAMYLADAPRPVRVSGKVYANFGPRMKDYIYEGMWAGPPKLDGTFDVEDAAHAFVRFDNGLTMEVNATWAMNLPDNALPSVMGFFGDKGGMTFNLGGSELRLATEQDGHNVDLVPKLRATQGFEDQLRYFAQNIKKRTQPHADGKAGQLVQTIIEGIYESSRQDREIEV